MGSLRLGTQNSLYVIAVMHSVETVPPIFQASHAADDRFQIDLPGSQHRNDHLPILESVAEAALQGYGFLHQRVEREAQRLRPPSDLRDLSAWTHDVERGLQRRRCPGRVNHQMRSESIADPVDEIFQVDFL